MLKLGILASGRGSNLQSIIDQIESGALSAEIRVVISDQKNAQALARAKLHQLARVFVNPADFTGKRGFEQEMGRILQGYQVDLVVMAGFMRLLSSYFIRLFKGRVINIHPSLLPSFPGLHPQRQALEHGVKLSGCTVHFADEGVDSGPIILQQAVPISDDDTEESLTRRILESEHQLYPRAIQLFGEGRLVIDGRVVRILS